LLAAVAVSEGVLHFFAEGPHFLLKVGHVLFVDISGALRGFSVFFFLDFCSFFFGQFLGCLLGMLKGGHVRLVFGDGFFLAKAFLL
jgi:hypothetical protein